MEKIEKIKLISISSTISIICSVLIIVFIAISNSTSINDFKLSSIKYEKTSDSEYFSSYTGTATITCDDKVNTYEVVYSEKLVSGGNYDNIGEINYYTCIVHNGVGEIKTYDSSMDEKNFKQPKYEIEIVACQRLDK